MSRNVRGIGVVCELAVPNSSTTYMYFDQRTSIKQGQQLPHVDPQNVLVQSSHPLHPASWQTTSDRTTFRSQPRCRTRFLRVETDRGERLLGRFHSECRRTYWGEGDGGKAVEPVTGRRSRYDPMYRVERESAFSSNNGDDLGLGAELVSIPVHQTCQGSQYAYTRGADRIHVSESGFAGLAIKGTNKAADSRRKPSTSLGGPWPEETILPKSFLKDNAADYEAELVCVLPLSGVDSVSS